MHQGQTTPSSNGFPGAGSSSRIASELAQVLGGNRSSASAPVASSQAGVGGFGDDAPAAAAPAGSGSWWLEPSMLLPADVLLELVWTPDATTIFVKGVEEVEVWLHADDSCMFSHGGGAFSCLLPGAWGSCPAAEGLPAVGWRHKAAGLGGPAAPAAPNIPLVPGWLDNDADAAGLVEGLIDASEVSRVYAASALPVVPVRGVVAAASGAAGVVSVPVGQVAAQALKLRSTELRIKRTQLAEEGIRVLPGIMTAAAAAAGPLKGSNSLTQQLAVLTASQQLPQPLSTDVVEEQEVPGLGRFVATADGRVKVLFDDRTILNLSVDGSSCRLLLRDGTQREVLSNCPVGVEQYVQAALEFAAWAHTSPEQRAAGLRMQSLLDVLWSGNDVQSIAGYYWLALLLGRLGKHDALVQEGTLAVRL
eukprot:gene2740-3036_t